MDTGSFKTSSSQNAVTEVALIQSVLLRKRGPDAAAEGGCPADGQTSGTAGGQSGRPHLTDPASERGRQGRTDPAEAREPSAVGSVPFLPERAGDRGPETQASRGCPWGRGREAGSSLPAWGEGGGVVCPSPAKLVPGNLGIKPNDQNAETERKGRTRFTE